MLWIMVHSCLILEHDKYFSLKSNMVSVLWNQHHGFKSWHSFKTQRWVKKICDALANHERVCTVKEWKSTISYKEWCVFTINEFSRRGCWSTFHWDIPWEHMYLEFIMRYTRHRGKLCMHEWRQSMVSSNRLQAKMYQALIENSTMMKF